jgi:ribosomal protein L11 methylase PrmA
MLVADGMDHPLLQARGPYDLLIANILAGPLISLAPDFARDSYGAAANAFKGIARAPAQFRAE